MTLGEKIRSLREGLKLRQQDIADYLGESSGRVIYNWEKGIAKPECSKIPKLCEILQVSADELLGCKSMEDRPTASEWVSIKKYRALDERGKTVVDNVLNTEYDILCNSVKKKKPKILQLNYFTMPASAGTGLFLDSELAEKILVYDCKEAEEADFVLSVKGDSMEPVFSDGDKIFVCKQDAVDVGEIGIFVLNGDVYVKELGNGKLISLNEKYKPIKITPDDSIYCCGRVLGVVEEV